MPHHFAKMYQNKSHRHDTPHESYGFDQAMGTITGMLYTIAKWPIKPFIPAFYKTEAEYKKDYEPIYNLPGDGCPCGCPADNCTCCCSRPEGCAHRK